MEHILMKQMTSYEYYLIFRFFKLVRRPNVFDPVGYILNFNPNKDDIIYNRLFENCFTSFLSWEMGNNKALKSSQFSQNESPTFFLCNWRDPLGVFQK